jgi:oxygen-independent coproporphyrinogen-3 oxidase
VYWEFGDYLGIGAGAHGKVTSPTGAAIERTVRARHPAAYLAATAASQGVTEARDVSSADLPFEFCLNTLRLVDGFTPRHFEERTGLPVTVLEEPAERARARGLLERVDGRWRATALGRRFLNDLQEQFLPV